MNDNFDGMYLYIYKDALPKYEIHGNYIHEYKKTWEPIYEIRGKLVCEYMRTAKPIYEIRGN